MSLFKLLVFIGISSLTISCSSDNLAKSESANNHKDKLKEELGGQWEIISYEESEPELKKDKQISTPFKAVVTNAEDLYDDSNMEFGMAGFTQACIPDLTKSGLFNKSEAQDALSKIRVLRITSPTKSLKISISGSYDELSVEMGGKTRDVAGITIHNRPIGEEGQPRSKFKNDFYYTYYVDGSDALKAKIQEIIEQKKDKNKQETAKQEEEEKAKKERIAKQLSEYDQFFISSNPLKAELGSSGQPTEFSVIKYDNKSMTATVRISDTRYKDTYSDIEIKLAAKEDWPHKQPNLYGTANQVKGSFSIDSLKDSSIGNNNQNKWYWKNGGANIEPDGSLKIDFLSADIIVKKPEN